MDGEPTAVSSMQDDDFADFTDQMRLSVAEGAYLFELPAGSRDLIGDTEWLVHGPWRQADCLAALRIWFDAELVLLLRRWPEDQALTPSEARKALVAPQSWVMDPDGGTNIAVEETEAGLALAWDEWRSMLAGLRGG